MMPWWRRGSLRIRLAVWYSVTGAVLLTVFSGVVYWFVENRLARPLDYNLRQDVAEVERRLMLDATGSATWDQQPLNTSPSGATDYPWFEVWDPQGRLVLRRWPLKEDELRRVPTAPVRNRDTISIFRVAEDTRLRVLSVPTEVTGSEERWMLRVIRLHRPAAEALGALLLIIGTALPVVVALLVLGGYQITRHWLKPLDELVTATGRINVENLTSRLVIANPADELGKLGTAFNCTLERLERSFRTLERFAADASHELRTPLTALRSIGEVALSYERPAAAYRETIGSMLEETCRLQGLVDRLLQLARAEGRTQQVVIAEYRLDEIVLGNVEKLRILADEKEQEIVTRLVPCMVAIDRLLFEQAFQNVLDNAIKHSPLEARIEVSAHETDQEFEIAVSDDGPGIGPGYRERIKNRFFQVTKTGAGAGGGVGLGLAITESYLRVLGGRLIFEPVLPHGSKFRLLVPKQPMTSGTQRARV